MLFTAVNNVKNGIQLDWSDWISVVAIIISIIGAYISLHQNRKLHNDNKNFELIEIRQKLYNQLKNSHLIKQEDVELYFSDKKLVIQCREYLKLIHLARGLNFDKNTYKGHLRINFEEEFREFEELEKNYEMDLSRNTDSGAELAFKEFCSKYEFDLPLISISQEPQQLKHYNYYELYVAERELSKKARELREKILNKMWKIICNSTKNA